MAWHKRFQPEKPVELPDKLDDCADGPESEVVVLSPLLVASEAAMEFCC